MSNARTKNEMFYNHGIKILYNLLRKKKPAIIIRSLRVLSETVDENNLNHCLRVSSNKRRTRINRINTIKHCEYDMIYFIHYVTNNYRSSVRTWYTLKRPIYRETNLYNLLNTSSKTTPLCEIWNLARETLSEIPGVSERVLEIPMYITHMIKYKAYESVWCVYSFLSHIIYHYLSRSEVYPHLEALLISTRTTKV